MNINVNIVANTGVQVRSGVGQQPAERLLGGRDAVKTSTSEHHSTCDDGRVSVRPAPHVLCRYVQVFSHQICLLRP